MNANPKPLWLLFFNLGVCAACAQGYIGTFNGYAPAHGASLAYVRDWAAASVGPPLSKAVGRVEILSIDGMILSPAKDGYGSPLAVDGLFALGIIAIPGSTPGQPASVVLRAWDNSTGFTYATALEKDQVLVTFPMVGSQARPSNFVTDSNFVGLELGAIREPTTTALGALGIGAGALLNCFR